MATDGLFAHGMPLSFDLAPLLTVSPAIVAAVCGESAGMCQSRAGREGHKQRRKRISYGYFLLAGAGLRRIRRMGDPRRQLADLKVRLQA